MKVQGNRGSAVLADDKWVIFDLADQQVAAVPSEQIAEFTPELVDGMLSLVQTGIEQGSVAQMNNLQSIFTQLSGIGQIVNALNQQNAILAHIAETLAPPMEDKAEPPPKKKPAARKKRSTRK